MPSILCSLSALFLHPRVHNPFLRTLLPSLGLAFALQAGVAVPSILGQSERYYDLSGSLTYISVVGLSLALPALRARAAAAGGLSGKLGATTVPSWGELLVGAFRKSGQNVAGGTAAGVAWNWRQVVLTAAVGIWAGRLGTYLFERVRKDGSDSRFDEIKKSPPQFLAAFLAQATWVCLCALPVLAINSLPATTFAHLPAVMATDVAGLALWLGGLAFEVVADRQKRAWSAAKKRKEHDEQFLTRGLWSKSRHPNYFGESVLWTGIAVVAAGVLASRAGVVGMGWSAGSLMAGRATAVLMAAVSPAFVTFLLLKISGVPLSEGKYDKRYGDRKDYQEWKKNTPMFIPKF